MAEGTEEADLLTRLRGGEDSAYEELIRLHAGSMRFAARRLLRHDADADEVVQEAFLAAFRSIGSFRGESGLKTWLRRIATNLAMMRLRARGSREDGKLAGDLPHFADCGAFAMEQIAWAPDGDGPEARAMHREMVELVRASIELLPLIYRTALILRDLECYTNTELAEQLELSPNAAKLRVHRGRQLLREILHKRQCEVPA